MRRKLVQTLCLLACRGHSTGVGNLEHASEIAGAFQVGRSWARSRGASEQRQKGNACAHTNFRLKLLTDPRELLTGEHVHHPGAADARFHHHESGMFVHDSANDCGVFA